MITKKGVTAFGLNWIADGLRRIVSSLLLGLTWLVCASSVCAQAPPDNAYATWAGGHAVYVWIVACQVSTEASCESNLFSVYRDPPGYTQLLGSGTINFSNKSLNFLTDASVTPGKTYTYKVCGGGNANSSSSNCIYTKPYTVPNPPPPPPPPLQAWVKLSASPNPAQYGQTTLSWTSGNATNIILEPGDMTGLSLNDSITMTGLTQATTYTAIVSGSHGTATSSVTVYVQKLCQPFAPPQNLSHAPYSASFKWTNPNTSPNKPYETCPSSPTDVVVYREDTGGYQQLADLTANNGVLPSNYTDWGPTQPHLQYWYAVCEGAMSGPTPSTNCAGVQFLTWGVNPVLTATRMNATTVNLEIAVDQYTVSSISVTRVGSDDPCYQQAGAQGIKLGNGLQGCSTVGPYGTPIHANPLTVYSWTSNPGVTPSWTFNSQSAPWVINIPDDKSVQPGVAYYYQAQVAWEGELEQDSDTVTVPVFNPMLASQRLSPGGLQPLKLSGGAPPPSQAGATARSTMAPMVRATSPTKLPASSTSPPVASQSRVAAATMATPMSARVTPAPSAAMISPGGSPTAAQSQSVTATRPIIAPMVTPTTPMLQPGHPMMSSTDAAAAPPLAQPAAARLTVPRMTTPPSRTTLPLRPTAASPEAANINAALAKVQQTPHDAQALYALGKAYCAGRLRDTGVSYLYMALRLAEQAGDAALAAQIRTSLAEQGVRAK